VKVIKDASKRAWSYKSDCTDCGSTLQVDKADLTLVADSRDGDAFTFVCPVCAHKNWVDARLIQKRACR
jgi:hypothetical protein